MPAGRLFLVDGSSLVYRSYYALMRGGRAPDGGPSGLRTRGGLPTGAVYGLLVALRKLLAEHAPDYVGIAFDARVPTFRHEAYEAYKANRKPMPEDLALQLPYVRRAVEALRIPHVTEERFEADDVIGTLARKGAEAGLEVVIVTSDKDMYQLLGPRVSMLQVRTETRLVRAEDVPAEFGVPPERVVDVLALWGDPSDNIPGVAGIGEKGAKAIVAELGSLDDIYRGLDRLKPAQAAKLRASEADARLSRDLATIRTDLDLPLDLERLRRQEPDRSALHDLCAELEFRSLAEELAPKEETALRVVASGLAAIDALLERARARGVLGVEPVLAASDPVRMPLLGLAVAAGPDDVAWIPAGSEGDESAAALERVDRILSDPGLRKAAASLKPLALLRLRRGRLPVHGPAGLAHDVSVLSYLLEPGRASHDVGALARELVGRDPRPLEALLGKGRERRALAEIPAEEIAPWAAERAELALALAPRLEADVETRGLGPLYRDVELPLVEVLAAMEAAGVRVDVPFLRTMSAELEERLGAITRQLHVLAGAEFNPASPKQLAEILFEKMQIPVLKKTRKSRAASTDIEVLEELARTHELPRLVLEHRELAKLRGTYVDALPALVHPVTGRVHTSYNQTVAATGRLSSSDPNLQNIPIRTELGRRIRRAFVAEPGATLVVADYSQIELRLLAHLSGDPELLAAFRDRADVHARTAATMFGIAEGLVTGELRRRAKTINFGIIYGMSPYGLSRELGIPPAEAQRLIAAYFERYSGVRAWLDRTVAETRERGYSTTLLGRIRQIPEIASENRSVREYAERTAVNTPLQGTAADLIKIAMVRVHRRLGAERLSARLILQVHDELVLEAPEAEARGAATIVREEMAGAHPLSVDLEVSVGTGPSWLEAK